MNNEFKVGDCFTRYDDSGSHYYLVSANDSVLYVGSYPEGIYSIMMWDSLKILEVLDLAGEVVYTSTRGEFMGKFREAKTAIDNAFGEFEEGA